MDVNDWTKRCSRAARSSASSVMAGATDSAAAVGVEQRRSPTMSQMEVSGSCPIPVTTGTGQAATARASDSSLKVIRSSNDPPPRTSRMQSGAGVIAAARRSPSISSSGAPSPCTLDPTQISSTSGLRRRSVRLTSSITAPDNDVTTATREQNAGIRRRRDSSIRPSRRSFSASAATCWRSMPSPASENERATKLILPWAL